MKRHTAGNVLASSVLIRHESSRARQGRGSSCTVYSKQYSSPLSKKLSLSFYLTRDASWLLGRSNSERLLLFCIVRPRIEHDPSTNAVVHSATKASFVFNLPSIERQYLSDNWQRNKMGMLCKQHHFSSQAKKSVFWKWFSLYTTFIFLLQCTTGPFRSFVFFRFQATLRWTIAEFQPSFEALGFDGSTRPMSRRMWAVFTEHCASIRYYSYRRSDTNNSHIGIANEQHV